MTSEAGVELKRVIDYSINISGEILAIAKTMTRLAEELRQVVKAIDEEQRQ
jgi:hypothetical protein